MDPTNVVPMPEWVWNRNQMRLSLMSIRGDETSFSITDQSNDPSEQTRRRSCILQNSVSASSSGVIRPIIVLVDDHKMDQTSENKRGEKRDHSAPNVPSKKSLRIDADDDDDDAVRGSYRMEGMPRTSERIKRRKEETRGSDLNESHLWTNLMMVSPLPSFLLNLMKRMQQHRINILLIEEWNRRRKETSGSSSFPSLSLSLSSPGPLLVISEGKERKIISEWTREKPLGSWVFIFVCCSLSF